MRKQAGVLVANEAPTWSILVRYYLQVHTGRGIDEIDLASARWRGPNIPPQVVHVYTVVTDAESVQITDTCFERSALE